MSHKAAKLARKMARLLSDDDGRSFLQHFQQAARDCGATPRQAKDAAQDLAQALHQAPAVAAKLLPNL